MFILFFTFILCCLGTDAAVTRGASTASIPWADLATLPELNPPSVMPEGNVGTSLSTFMALIQTCKLPSYLIRKLQLEFPKSRSAKKYGAVAFEYDMRRYGGRFGGVSGQGSISKDTGGGSVSDAGGGCGNGDGADSGSTTADTCKTEDHGDVDIQCDGGGKDDSSDDEDDGVPSVSIIVY